MSRISEWLTDAAAIEGILGVQYCTWIGNFHDLAKFLDQVRSAMAKRG